MKRIVFVFVFVFVPYAVYAQIPTCVNALAAKPQGPFPCSVTAQWQDNSTNESGFILERRLNGGAWTMIGGGPLAVNVTSVVDATLQQSATVDNVYDYRVITVNSAGQAPPSNIAGFTVTKAVTIPAAASNLVITFKGATGDLDLDPGKKVKLKDDNGTFTISAAEVTINYK